MRQNLIVINILLACLAIGACTRTPEIKSVANRPTPGPIPSGAEKVVKPINVSFSSYSKDWPVGWEWIDPDEDRTPTRKDVKKGVLRATIPTGKNLLGTMSAPRYLKVLEGDFQIETRVAFSPKENYQGAGLLIYVDDRHFLRFERAYGGTGGGGEGIRLDVADDEGYRPLATPDDIPTGAGSVDLKIIRTGELFLTYWRENEGTDWKEAGGYESKFPTVVRAGLVMANTAREITVEFGYIRLEPVGI